MNDAAFPDSIRREGDLSGETAAGEQTPAPEIEDCWFPLTIAQRGMWFAQRLGPDDAVFNLAEKAELFGEIDVEAFNRAVRHTELEATATRLRFIEIDGEPLQAVTRGLSGVLPHLDFSDAEDPQAAAVQWMEDEFRLRHDPLQDRLWATCLITVGKNHHIWYHRSHHILIDGFAGGLIARRVAEVYNMLIRGETPELTPFGSLNDLVREDHAYRQSERFEAERNYWTTSFADKPSPTSLAHYRPGLEGVLLRHTTMLAAGFVEDLRAAARAAQGTFPQLMIAAFAIYYYRMTGAEDLVLGLPVTARTNRSLRRIPSMLANAVPLRLRLKPADSVADVVRRVGRGVREALRHQRYRYEDLRRDLNLLGEGRHLFTSVVNIEPFDYALNFGEARCEVTNLSNGSIEDMAIFVYDRGSGQPVHIDFDANPRLYSEAQLAAHTARIQQLLRQVCEDVERPISRLPLLDDVSRARLLAAGSPAAAAPAMRFMPEDFERQAGESPWSVAVVYDGHAITYRGLDERANRIARALRARGARVGKIVGICLPRGIDMVAAMLGVMKSGAAYLPLDPDLPAARLSAMVEDAAPCLIFAAAETIASPAPCPVLTMERLALEQFPAEAPQEKRPPDAPAYVIYTSGSTGKPKGVVLTRANLANFLGAMAAHIPLDPADRMLAVTTISFDIAALELFLPLLAGARTILAPRAALRNPSVLTRLIAASGATIMQATPSLWDTLTGSESDALRDLRILTGGEALPEHLARQLCGLSGQVLNLYGPTETAIWSTLHAVESGDAAAIGRPIARTQVYVLDSGLMQLPEGVAGDLYIAGAGLAQGYLNRPGLTAERFVADPYGPPGSRMYRTGDLAKFEHGVLHYIGRADSQVKLRGFRIELGEIETALTGRPGIAQAAVAVHEGRLVAYIVPAAPKHEPDLAVLKRALARQLPDYMVPALFVVLPEMPRSPSGKLDRKALPAPAKASAGPRQLDRSPTEEILISMFCELIRTADDIDVEANIFELGLDSLMVAKIVAQVRNGFGVDLPLMAMFETTTIAGLARLIDDAAHGHPVIERQLRPARIPLGASQRLMFDVSLMPGVGAAYNMSLGLRLRGTLDAAALAAAFNDLLERHETLRTMIDADADEPAQVILPPQAATLALAAVPVTEAEMPAQLNMAARQTFDVTSELPMRLYLWQLAPDDHVLLVAVHHVAADGGSLAPLVRDLAQAYAARLAGEAPAWQPLALQYADYALWQQQQQSRLSGQLEFWVRTLEGVPQLALPVDAPYPPMQRFGGSLAPIRIDAELHAGLIHLARSHGASLFMLLQAGLAVLLSRRGAGEDIPIGSPFGGRLDVALDPMVGCFFNHLVLRTDVSGDPSFIALVERIRRFNITAYANQDVPFASVAAALGARPDGARHPLFQVMLNFLNHSFQEFEMAGLHVAPEPVALGTARYELTFVLSETRDAGGKPTGIAGGIEYRTDLFKPETAAGLASQLAGLLRQAVAAPQTPVSAFALEG